MAANGEKVFLAKLFTKLTELILDLAVCAQSLAERPNGHARRAPSIYLGKAADPVELFALASLALKCVCFLSGRGKCADFRRSPPCPVPCECSPLSAFPHYQTVSGAHSVSTASTVSSIEELFGIKSSLLLFL